MHMVVWKWRVCLPRHVAGFVCNRVAFSCLELYWYSVMPLLDSLCVALLALWVHRCMFCVSHWLLRLLCKVRRTSQGSPRLHSVPTNAPMFSFPPLRSSYDLDHIPPSIFVSSSCWPSILQPHGIHFGSLTVVVVLSSWNHPLPWMKVLQRMCSWRNGSHIGRTHGGMDVGWKVLMKEWMVE